VSGFLGFLVKILALSYFAQTDMLLLVLLPELENFLFFIFTNK